MNNKIDLFEWMELNLESPLWMIALFLFPVLPATIHGLLVSVDDLWTLLLWLIYYPLVIGLGKIKAWKP
jgi:hypothetical protein